jgi:ribosomal-protein-alanine N-acetyltransferase
VGFFAFRREGDAVVAGLELRPDLTGRGLGIPFHRAGLELAHRRYAPARFRLIVATFYRRAIRVSQQAGFCQGETFAHWANVGKHEFVGMERTV